MRHNRRNDNPGGPRLVPYTPKRIKGSPNKRCYVNNLPYDLKWQQFKDHMKEGRELNVTNLSYIFKPCSKVVFILFERYSSLASNCNLNRNVQGKTWRSL